MQSFLQFKRPYTCYCTRSARPSLLRAAAAATPSAATIPKKQLLYDGIALDMDGTLTSCVIDFQDMRKRTGEGASSAECHLVLDRRLGDTSSGLCLQNDMPQTGCPKQACVRMHELRSNSLTQCGSCEF
jgi:hypothetical protein